MCDSKTIKMPRWFKSNWIKTSELIQVMYNCDN